jgi:hypothetical protein
MHLLSRSAAGAALAAACLASQPAAAESDRLVYALMVGGLHVGDAMVSVEETANAYRAQMKMNAAGAVRWFKTFGAAMTSEGSVGRSASSPIVPLPARYKREWSAGDLAETMTMTFDPATRIATAEDRVFNPVTGAPLTHEDLPWNGRHSRHPPVPANLRTNVYDPMTAFLAGRALLRAGGMAPKSFRIPIYDGTRRYDIVGRTQPVRTVNIGGKDRELLPVVGKLEAVFGFSDEAKEHLAKIDGKLYFTPDQRFLPVQSVVSGEFFNAVMNLTADCRADTAACAAFDKAGEQKAQAN